MLLQLIVFVAVCAALLKVNVVFDRGIAAFKVRALPSLGIVVVGFMLGTVGDSFGIVSAGDTGVVTQFGAVQMGNLKREGLYNVVPGVQHVYVMDTKPHKITLDDVEAVTSDRQAVHISVALLVQVDPATADATYRNYRDTIVDQVVMPKFQEAVKTVTARYDAKTQVQDRALVQQEMLAYVQHELQGKGIIIGPGALSIMNFAYNDEYQHAIEDTAVAQQNLVKAEAELKVNQIEAEQKIATARGEAESQALLAKTINSNSLQYEFYKHWDGHLPAVIGSAAGNILDVSALMHGH